MIIAAGIAAAVLLLLLEWRRSDQRHRVARVVASLLAVAALVVWRLLPAALPMTPRVEESAAALWTSGANADREQTNVSATAHRFTFADVDPKPADAAVIPDAAFLRREHPEVNRLHIVGDGLEGFELEALRGLQVSYQRGGSTIDRPAISWLHAPRNAAVGEQIEIRGRVHGVTAGDKVRVLLEGPEGSESSVIVNADRESTFALSAPALAAEGRFEWRIKLVRDDDAPSVLADERIGIAIMPPKLPRVLVLESSPNLDTAHLQRWLAESGGVVNARTLVGEGRYRFSAAEFPQIDARLLAEFDVLIVDARALAGLSPVETEAIRVAVAEEGLGVLILPRGERSLPNEFGTAKILPGATEVGSEKRSARLWWRGLSAPLEFPVGIENAAIEPNASQTALINDSRSSALVTASRRGRGEIALSLVRDTWQWRLQNQSATFAQYWSFLLNRLTKPAAAESWRIANAIGAPLVIHQPVELEYTTSNETPSPGEVRAAAGEAVVVLPLAQDADEPRRWRTTYWPRTSGWHRVAAPAGGAWLDFFVHEATEWLAVRSERRRDATERFAVLSKQSPLTPTTAETGESIAKAGGAWVCFAVFLLTSSYLWYERRSAGTATAAAPRA